MEVPKQVPSCTELHAQVVNAQNHIKFAPTKKLLMQVTKETLAQVLEVDHQATKIGIKSAFISSLEMALIDKI